MAPPEPLMLPARPVSFSRLAELVQVADVRDRSAGVHGKRQPGLRAGGGGERVAVGQRATPAIQLPGNAKDDAGRSALADIEVRVRIFEREIGGIEHIVRVSEGGLVLVVVLGVRVGIAGAQVQPASAVVRDLHHHRLVVRANRAVDVGDGAVGRVEPLRKQMRGVSRLLERPLVVGVDHRIGDRAPPSRDRCWCP